MYTKSLCQIWTSFLLAYSNNPNGFDLDLFFKKQKVKIVLYFCIVFHIKQKWSQSTYVYLQILLQKWITCVCSFLFCWALFRLNQKPIVLVSQVFAGYDTTQNFSWK